MNSQRTALRQSSEINLMTEAIVVYQKNIGIGLRVRRNPDNWRPRKWRDDAHGSGVVVGFTDESGALVGENASPRFVRDVYNQIPDQNGPGWAVVQWEAGKRSVYPIGASNCLGSWWSGGPCFSLLKD
jgi:hypothetical protein